MISGDQARQKRIGVMYGVAAYLWWGFCPFYFKAVAAIPAFEVLAHRIVWSVVLLYGLLRWFGRLGDVRVILRDRRTIAWLAMSTVVIAINWLTFIWAVAHARLTEASLGYFINPLVNVLLGYVFLHERLRPLQWVAVVLAGIGVTYLTLGAGMLPWVALVLAFSFGFYGLLRKTARADSLLGLTVETTMLAPVMLMYLLIIEGGALVDGGTVMRVLLPLGGVVTAVPLLWFAHAARRLRLVTVGFVQYLAPSLQLTVAVVFFGEAFAMEHAITFAFIWVGLVVYSYDTIRGRERKGSRDQGIEVEDGGPGPTR